MNCEHHKMTTILLPLRSIFVPLCRVTAANIRLYAAEYLHRDFGMAVFGLDDKYEIIIWDVEVDPNELRNVLLNKINTGRLTPAVPMLDQPNEIRLQLAPSISVDEFVKYCTEKINEPIDLVIEEVDGIIWTIVKFDHNIHKVMRDDIMGMTADEQILHVNMFNEELIRNKLYEIFVKYLPRGLPGGLPDDFSPTSFRLMRWSYGFIVTWDQVKVSRNHLCVFMHDLVKFFFKKK